MSETISHYTVLEPLGRGGMGEVYAGFDNTLRRRVALKAIRADHRLKPHARARFLREARILSQLDHPRICRIYDYIVGDDSDFLVLELIGGRSLTAELDAGLAPAVGLSIAEQIADVLVAAHAAGIVHRDLKPGNVMVGANGDVKVLDFGLASSGTEPADPPEHDIEPVADTPLDVANVTWPQETAVTDLGAQTPDAAHLAASRSRVTATLLFQTQGGQVIGTPAYMSPEQARGEPATAPSDMYSFGLLLQELCTGEPAYDDSQDVITLLSRAAQAETRPPTGIDTDLATLIQRLKAPAPTHRPTAVETAERLRWIREKPKRRLTTLAAVAVVVGLALGGVKYTVDLSRERTVAVEAREDADRRRDQAEDLIGFMVGDLRAKLEPVGRLEILDDVGDQAMNYFASVPEETLTDEELLRFSRALYQIGDVRIARGNLDDATAPLERSLALAGTLVDRAPNDPDRLFELGQSHFWVGFVHWRRRNLDTALDHLERYMAAAEQLVRMDPANADWQLELAMAHSNIGSVLEERGDLTAALERYHWTFGIVDTLAEGAPDDVILQDLLASTHNTIGEVARATGDLDTALTRHRTELAIRETLAASEPANNAFRAYLATSESFVGGVLESQGKYDLAIGHYDRAVSINEDLVELDDENTTWRHGLARNLFKRGRVQLSQGAATAAQVTLDLSVDRLVRLVEADPTQRWQRDLALARVWLGDAQVNLGHLPAAEQQAQDALALTDELLGADATDRRSSLAQERRRPSSGPAAPGSQASRSPGWPNLLSVSREPMADRSRSLPRSTRTTTIPVLPSIIRTR